MDDDHVPELLLSVNAEESLNKYGILAWSTLFSILFAPEVDGQYKRRHASDMILFTDEEFYVAYRIMPDGDIQVGFIHSEADMSNP